MLLGIDVGGTFTDAVVVNEGAIVAQAKSPTTGDLMTGMLRALDTVLADVSPAGVRRVALSTTYVTNALIQGKVSSVGLALIPGPGMDYGGLLPAKPLILDGYTDHRGREAAPFRREQLEAMRSWLSGHEVVAVSAKFSVRNPNQESQVAEWIRSTCGCQVTCGAEVSGGLNFLRRTNSAYFNAAVWKSFSRFADSAQSAIHMRQIQAPIFILKADGGTLPLDFARRLPVEAIFTGPAAGVLGILAAARPQGDAVSLDIGGTTTDIALWRDGLPLLAPQGVRLSGYPTAVRSFRLRSVGIGGDSAIRREEKLIVGPERLGPPVALGGKVPTLSDAMIVAGLMDFGDRSLAGQAMQSLAFLGQTAETMAAECLAIAVEVITREIQAMIAEHYSEPVYRVDDILARTILQPETIIAVGGAGKGLGQLISTAWGENNGCHCKLEIPPHSAVINAIGAATARPTLLLTVRADTEQGYYSVPELGIRLPLRRQNTSVAAVRQLAEQHLAEQAALVGIAADTVETVLAEEFNLVRGFNTVGKNIIVQLQVKPGVLTAVSGKEAAL